MSHQMAFQRICSWSGVICVAMFFLAFAIAGFIPPLSPGDSPEEVAAHYQSHTTGIRIGGIIMLISGAFYAAFTAVVSAQMRRIPGVHPAAVYTQLAAGAFGCVTFLLPAMLLEVAAFRPERAAESTQILNDFFWIFLVLPWPPFATQNWTFAYAILSDPGERTVFPRWLAYVNLWCPVIFAPSVFLPFFKHGVFAWNGLLVIWIPALAFIAQFGANLYGLLGAIRAEERGQMAADPSAVPDGRREDLVRRG